LERAGAGTSGTFGFDTEITEGGSTEGTSEKEFDGRRREPGAEVRDGGGRRRGGMISKIYTKSKGLSRKIISGEESRG
jgi:hypothetical protein